MTPLINVGVTNLITDGKDVTLQKSRPWYNSDEEGLNTKVDNEVTMTELFADKTVALFGIPAPFTGTCTKAHYPGYQQLAADFKSAGVDEIVCYTVADPYAHNAWAKSMKNNSKDITFLADPDASFAKTFVLDALSNGITYADYSLGPWNPIRFSSLVVNGVVKSFHIVEDAKMDAETLLADAKAAAASP
jgi:glutaredoxin/glutathione-dependent peroxiredoxin